MAQTQITVTFISLPTNNDTISFVCNNSVTNSDITITRTFKSTLDNTEQCLIKSSLDLQAQAYADSITTDPFNNEIYPYIFGISVSGPTVTITIIDFSDFDSFTTLTSSSGFIETTFVDPLQDFCSYSFNALDLFFTKDLNYLDFHSQNNNTYVLISLELKVYKLKTYDSTTYNRQFKLPLFKGKGNFHVGTIVHQLISEVGDLSDFFSSFSENYYENILKPSTVKITIEEKLFDTSELPEFPLVIGIIPMFKMIKGVKPFTTINGLSLLSIQQQAFSRITINSPIVFSFTYNGAPKIVVKKNNIPIEMVEIDQSTETSIYTYCYFYSSKIIGDIIEFFIVNDDQEIRVQRYVVYPEGMDSTKFYFENDYGLPETFEFIGRRLINSAYKFSSNRTYKNLFEKEKKEVSNSLQSISVNTGNLGYEDLKIIDGIIKTRNCWMTFNNDLYVNVDCITTKLPILDSFKNEIAATLEFNLLENSDVKIYS